jgi:hypothetical protein
VHRPGVCGTKKDDHHSFVRLWRLCVDERLVLPIRLLHPASRAVTVGCVSDAPANREANPQRCVAMYIPHDETTNGATLECLTFSDDARKNPVTPKDF